MDIYNFAQSTLNKIVVFTQSDAQDDRRSDWPLECHSEPEAKNLASDS